jgi:SSS family solute:Na+ symporter
MFGFAIYGMRYAKTTDSFLTGARRGTLLVVASSYMASHFGAGFVIGGAEYGARFGLSGVWYGLACSLSYVVFGLLMVKRIYREGHITVPDLLRKRYGDNVTASGFAAINTFACIGIIAGQIMAGQRLLQALGMDAFTGAVLFMVIVIAYCALSGLWGIMVTDVIQTAIGVGGLIMAYMMFFGSEGIGSLRSSLPADSFSWITSSWSTYDFLMILVPTTLYGFISQPSYQRTVASKNEKVAVWSPFVAALALIPIAFLPVFLGMYGRSLYPEMAPGAVFFTVIIEHMPVWAGALMLAAILAIVMSTADSLLIAVTAHIVHDFYQKTLNPKASDQQCKILSYAVTVGVGIFATYVALSFTTIIGLLSFTYSVLVAATLAPVLAGFFWDGANSKGAICGMITGVAVLFLNRFGIVTFPYAALTASIPALIVLVVVSIATAKKS